jgi:hypothetical protein
VLPFLLPALIFLPCRYFLRRKSVFVSIAVTVLATWLLLNCFWHFVFLPVAIPFRRSTDNDIYDGITGSQLTLLVGWLPPLVVCLVLLGFFRLLNRSNKRNVHSDARGKNA